LPVSHITIPKESLRGFLVVLGMLIVADPVLYVFFKFFLNSKIIPIEAIDLKTEFESIRREREAGEEVGMEKSGSSQLKAVVARMRNWI
jgi:hypothetical protein